MSKQLHNNFTDDQVKSLFKSYVDKKIKINYILKIHKIKRGRFFWIPGCMLRRSR
jgi:hypothetical protein